MPTTQTPQGQVITLTMINISGTQPTVLNLLYSGQTFPAADGSITVDSRDATALISSGWEIKVSAGTTHVP